MSKNKNNRRGVKKRVFLAPMAGDPGPPLLRPNPQPLPDRVSLDALTTRQLLQRALKVGIDPKIICGIAQCGEHVGMVKLGEGFHNSKNFAQFAAGIDLLWCRQCWSWWREKKPLDLEEFGL